MHDRHPAEEGNESYVFSADLADPGRFWVAEQGRRRRPWRCTWRRPTSPLMGEMGNLGVTGVTLTKWTGATAEKLM